MHGRENRVQVIGGQGDGAWAVAKKGSRDQDLLEAVLRILGQELTHRRGRTPGGRTREGNTELISDRFHGDARRLAYRRSTQTVVGPFLTLSPSITTAIARR